MNLFKNTINKDINYKDHHSIEDSIPILELLENGIIKNLNNKYSMSYKLQDINYTLSDLEDKRMILDQYKSMLNSFDESVERSRCSVITK